MKLAAGFAVTKLAALLALVLAIGAGCHPLPPCAPNDRSCLPCSDRLSTNPTCGNWPTDARKPRPKETR